MLHIIRSNYSPYTLTQPALCLGLKSSSLFWLSTQLRIWVSLVQVQADPPGCRGFLEMLRAGTVFHGYGGYDLARSLEPPALPVWIAVEAGEAWLAF